MKYVNKMLAIALAFVLALGNMPVFADSGNDLKGHWGEDEIKKLQEEGLVSGYADGSFRPNAKVSRFEVAVMIARANMLSCWADQNKDNINKFLNENPQHGRVQTQFEEGRDVRKLLSTTDKSNDSQNSKLFDMWSSYYGNSNGVWADTTADLFIKG